MAMKRMALPLAMILLSPVFSACGGNPPPFVVEMDLTGNSAGPDPVVSERPFSVSDNVDSVDFEAYLQMKSETCTLQLADKASQNPMVEISWQESFNNSGRDKENITLYDLDKDKEYVIRLTCAQVEDVKLAVTSDNSLVTARE